MTPFLNFTRMLVTSALIRSMFLPFSQFCKRINLLLFILTVSVFSYNLVGFWDGRGMHNPWREPREPESSGPGKELPRGDGRDGSTEGRGVGLRNGSPSYCLQFPAGLFLVHTGLSYKGLQPRHTLINDNNRDNRQTNTTFLHVDRSNSNLRLNTWSLSSHLQTRTPRSRNFKSCSGLLLKVALYQHKREIAIKRYRLTLDRS